MTAEKYREALDIDKKLMGEGSEQYPSWYRDAMLRDIASATLEQGRTWMRRDDRQKACKFWRLGFEFYKANADLNRAVGNQCSNVANSQFLQAQSCGDLDNVLLLAIDGDGVREKVAAKKTQMACP